MAPFFVALKERDRNRVNAFLEEFAFVGVFGTGGTLGTLPEEICSLKDGFGITLLSCWSGAVRGVTGVPGSRTKTVVYPCASRSRPTEGAVGLFSRCEGEGVQTLM